MKSRVGGGDPGELDLLVLAEVLRVLPQRVAGALQRHRALAAGPRGRVRSGTSAAAFRLGPGQFPGVVPRLAADLV